MGLYFEEGKRNMQDKAEASYTVIFKDGVGRCVAAARDLKVRDRVGKNESVN